MDFELSEERRMIKDTAERFIRERYTLDVRHAAVQSEIGYSREMWSEFGELGLIGALMPPEVEGFGGTGEDIALIFEIIGKGLVVEPFLPALMAAQPLIAHGPVSTLQSLMAAETIVAFAHSEPEARYTATHVQTQADADGDDWCLSGRKSVVLSGASAQLLVVSARVSGAPSDTDGLGLFMVSPSAGGVTLDGFRGIDGPHVAEVSLERAHGTPIGAPGNAWTDIERALAVGTLAVCAEAVGTMDVARDMTLAYLKERTQFGQPIGANQALQHRMVDMMLEIEQARSAVLLAASTLDAPADLRDMNLSAAKHLIGRVGRLVAEEAIQMHGGVAMTWEWPLPHFAKRLMMIDHLFGDEDHHLQRFVTLSAAVNADAASS